MLFKKEARKKRGFGGIFGLFRLFLSIVIFGILFLGLYQAYKSFAGVDPLKASPKAILRNFISSDAAYKFVVGLLSFNPNNSLQQAKNIIKKPGDNPVIPSSSQAPLLYKFAVLADSENDNTNLEKALKMAKDSGAVLIIGGGDYTDVGTVDELTTAKLKFDATNLPYYLAVGDHDLWDSRNRGLSPVHDFNQVFGSAYSTFNYQDTRFIIIYNVDTTGLDDVQMNWLTNTLSQVKTEKPKNIFVFTGTPLYHPSSDHWMGDKDPKLKTQADQLINSFKSNDVSEVITGDTHFFSRYSEPKTNLKMTTVGAITSVRNPQAPRFALVDVYADGSYNIEDVEIK